MINHYNICQGLTYEREKMGNNKKNKKRKWYKEIDEPSIITGVIIELLVLLIVAWIGWLNGFLQLPEKVTDIDGKIDKHINDQEKFNENITARVDGLYSSRVSLIDRAITLNTDSINIGELFQNSYEENTFMDSPPIKEDSVLYKDNTIEFLAKDLVDKKIIIPYSENGKDIFFCGQFDDSFKWDGTCLINVYSNNQLILATLEVYSHGNRTEYEQIFSNKDNWFYSKRITEDDVNIGDTWIYSGIDGYTQTISYEEPDENELILPDIIKNDTRGKLISRYHGNTSEGSYNDTTGTAYLIQFDSEGTVRTLYYGNFIDGKFSDESKHAWYITRNPETNTDYMYYMGKFSSGNPYPKYSDECSYFENPLTRTTFNRVMSGREYDCEMTWAEECIVSNDN